MKPMARKALVVMGMHRSGTSALARMLSLMGATLPRRVMPANAGNASGYWEPEAIVRLNDRILDAYGLRWNDAFAEARLPGAGELVERFGEEAARLLADEYGDSALIVLKDPRITVLQEFWRAVLHGAGIAMLPVVVSRPPAEVVASLLRRDDGDPQTAALAYASYGLHAASAQPPAVFLTYAQLLADWKACAARAASTFGLEWPRTDAAADAAIDAFLQPAKKWADAEVDGSAGVLAEAVWQCLEDAAQGTPCAEARVATLKAELQALVQAAVPLLVGKNRELHTLGAERDQLDAARLETGAERDRALSERDETLARFRDSEAQLAQAATDRDRALAERNDALARFEASQSQLARTAGERDQALSERDEALARFRDSDAQLARAATDRDRALSERDEALARFRDSDAQLARTAAERDRALSDRNDALARFEESQSQLARTAGERDKSLGERDAALAHFQESQSQLARTAGERDEALGERDQALSERDDARSRLDSTTLDRDQAVERLREATEAERALREERDSLLALYRSTDELLQKAQADYVAIEQRHDRLVTMQDRPKQGLAAGSAFFGQVWVGPVLQEQPHHVHVVPAGGRRQRPLMAGVLAVGN